MGGNSASVPPPLQCDEWAGYRQVTTAYKPKTLLYTEHKIKYSNIKEWPPTRANAKAQLDLLRIDIADTQSKLPNKSTEAFTERKLNDSRFFHARCISDQTWNYLTTKAISHKSFFSCSACCRDRSKPTPVTDYKGFYFLTLQSNPRDFWPFIRVIMTKTWPWPWPLHDPPTFAKLFHKILFF